MYFFKSNENATKGNGRAHVGGSICDARPIDPVSRQKGSAGDPLRALALSPQPSHSNLRYQHRQSSVPSIFMTQTQHTIDIWGVLFSFVTR